MAPPSFSSSYTVAPDKQPWTFLKIYGGAYSVWCCLGMSWGVWGRVLVYLGGILRCQNCLGVFGGYLRVQSMQDWAVLKPTHHFGKTVKWKICFTWSLWDIKIPKPKPPHKSFLKIIGLGHFLHFLCSSERYYLLQLLWITLYYCFLNLNLSWP